MSATYPHPSIARLVRSRVLVVLVGLALLVTVIAFGWRGLLAGSSDTPIYEAVLPQYGSLVATISAVGQIQPTQTAGLSFAVSGQIAEVLARPGDHIEAGEILARLDDRELRLRVADAQAALNQAKARYHKLAAGATPIELAAAQAQVHQATGQLQQAEGGVSPADIRAAEARLTQAQAQLTHLTAGPRATDLQAAILQVERARLFVEQQRTALSATKTNANLQLDQATAALTQAQSLYATATTNWQIVEQTGIDPLRPTLPDPTLDNLRRTRPNVLNDAQRRQYYDAYVQAEAALRQAESAVEAARVAYEGARQAEITGIQQAEAQLALAQNDLDRLRAGPTADQLAAARAQVATARADLDRLRGLGRDGTLATAQAGLELAQANLERLLSGPLSDDLAITQADVDRAQAALDLALLTLDQAILRAPFAATVSELNLTIGEVTRPNQPQITLADLSSFYVNLDVDEIDVAQLEAGQPVTLTLDALPDTTLIGRIESVGAVATLQAGINSYQVRVVTSAPNPHVRAGMTANAEIVVSHVTEALLIPRRAIRSTGGQATVEILDAHICRLAPAQRPANPSRTERVIRLGMADQEMAVIIAGLDAQTCVYIAPLDLRMDPLSGPPPGIPNNTQVGS